MSGTFETFLALSEQDKRDVFEAAAGPNYCRDRPIRTHDERFAQRVRHQCRLAIKALRNGKSTPTNAPNTAPSKLI